MFEDRKSDLSTELTIPRKRGRPPKSKDSILNFTSNDKKLENTIKDFFVVSETVTLQKSELSPLNTSSNDVLEQLNIPRKRGRPSKSKPLLLNPLPNHKISNVKSTNVDTSDKVDVNDTFDDPTFNACDDLTIPRKRGRPAKPLKSAKFDNIKSDDTAKEFHTPRRRGRPPKTSLQSITADNKKSDDLSAELLPACKRGRPSKSSLMNSTFKDVKSHNQSEKLTPKRSHPSKSGLLSQNSTYDDISDKRGRGRPRKSNSFLSTSNNSKQPNCGHADKEGIVGTPYTDPKKINLKHYFSPPVDVSKKVATPLKRGRPQKSKSSSLNATNIDGQFNGVDEYVTTPEKSRTNSKIMNLNNFFSPQTASKNLENDSCELKLYPIFNSPSLSAKQNKTKQETILDKSNKNCEFQETLDCNVAETDHEPSSSNKKSDNLIHETVSKHHSLKIKSKAKKNFKQKTLDKNSCNHEMINSASDSTIDSDENIFKNFLKSTEKIESINNSIVINDRSSRHSLEVETINNSSDKNNYNHEILNSIPDSAINSGENIVKSPQKDELKATENIESTNEEPSKYSLDIETINSSDKSIYNHESLNSTSDSAIDSDENISESLQMDKLKSTENKENCDDSIIVNEIPSRHSLKLKTGHSSEVNENTEMKNFPVLISSRKHSVQMDDACSLNNTLKNSDSHLQISEIDSESSEKLTINDPSTLVEIIVTKETEFCDSSDNTIDSHVSDSVEEKSIKSQESSDCEIEIIENIDQNVSSKYKAYNGKENSKTKLKQKKLKQIQSKHNIIENASDLEASGRRRSLRSRGVRNNFFNYSEVEYDVNISEKSKRGRPPKTIKNNNCIATMTKNFLESNNINSSKIPENSENKKENVKLFPIFTSNKASADLANANSTSNKRKFVCDNITVDDISGEEEKDLTRTKKTREEINVENSYGNVPTKSNHIASNCTKKFTATSDSYCQIIRESFNKNFSKQSENVDDKNELQFVTKKSHQIELVDYCFPKLSHVNIHKDTVYEKINNFQIEPEDIDHNVTIPSWSDNESLISVNCAEVIKSLENNSDMYEKVNNNSSTIVVEENSEYDMLWTDSMQKTVSKGKENENLIKEVKSWLLQWKNRFSKTPKSKKNSLSDSESYSSDSDSDDDFISNSIIIYGTPGSGKTSLVFSLASELGFTVLEVNASSHRSGRNISNQLKEALESYHMEGIKLEDVFDNSKFDIQKDNIRKHFPYKPEKPQTKNIKSFFEIENEGMQKKNKEKEKKQNAASIIANSKSKKSKDKNKKTNESQPKNSCTDNSNNFFEKLKSDKKSCRISSSTIILFDDVDVVFEEDEGFWSTVKGFLKISKKPVIFTVSRNLSIVKNMLNSDIEIFNMMPVSKDSALKTLKACCEMHSEGNTNIDLELLTSPNPIDLRRSILSTQFWSKKTKNGNVSVSNNPFENHAKFVSYNNFIAGDLNFSVNYMRDLLFNHLPNYCSNAISDYQRSGYDVLFSNLLKILSVLDLIKHEQVWKTLLDQQSTNTTKIFSDSQMWEEACEIFRQKKKALKSGSCSEHLFTISDVVEDFSFADMLKGMSPYKYQCISSAERIKMWTAGMPICSDHISWSYEDTLQFISLIHIYSLRMAQNKLSMDKISSDNLLILEHPFMAYDQTFASKTENDLMYLSAALPVSQQMNKVALTLDYLSVIKNICKDEESRQFNSGKRSGRFLHYFDSISFLIDKKTF